MTKNSKTRNCIGDSQSRSHKNPVIGGKLSRLDGRSAAAKAISRLVRRMIDDLGGVGGLSEQKRVLVAVTAREAVLLDSVDSELLCSPDGAAKRRRAYLELLTNRQRLSASLTRHLLSLGLSKIEAELTLADYLEAREREQAGGHDGASEPEASNQSNTAQDDREENTHSNNRMEDSDNEHVSEQ